MLFAKRTVRKLTPLAQGIEDGERGFQFGGGPIEEIMDRANGEQAVFKFEIWVGAKHLKRISDEEGSRRPSHRSMLSRADTRKALREERRALRTMLQKWARVTSEH